MYSVNFPSVFEPVTCITVIVKFIQFVFNTTQRTLSLVLIDLIQPNSVNQTVFQKKKDNDIFLPCALQLQGFLNGPS